MTATWRYRAAVVVGLLCAADACSGGTGELVTPPLGRPEAEVDLGPSPRFAWGGGVVAAITVASDGADRAVLVEPASGAITELAQPPALRSPSLLVSGAGELTVLGVRCDAEDCVSGQVVVARLRGARWSEVEVPVRETDVRSFAGTFLGAADDEVLFAIAGMAYRLRDGVVAAMPGLDAAFPLVFCPTGTTVRSVVLADGPAGIERLEELAESRGSELPLVSMLTMLEADLLGDAGWQPGADMPAADEQVQVGCTCGGPVLFGEDAVWVFADDGWAQLATPAGYAVPSGIPVPMATGAAADTGSSIVVVRDGEVSTVNLPESAFETVADADRHRQLLASGDELYVYVRDGDTARFASIGD